MGNDGEKYRKQPAESTTHADTFTNARLNNMRFNCVFILFIFKG